PAVTAAHGNRDVGVLGALLRRVRVGGGVLLVERRLADGLDGGLVAVPRGVLRRGLIGVVGVAGQRRRRRHVGLRDVTAATTAADRDRGVGVLRIELLRVGVGRGVLLAHGQLTDRLDRRTVATALELLIGALVGLVLVPRRGQR